MRSCFLVNGLSIGQPAAVKGLWPGVGVVPEGGREGVCLSQYALGKMYDKGHGVEQDYGQALVWFRKAADQGDANAQFAIGLMYDEIQGVEQDHVQAAAWWRKAAEQGRWSVLHSGRPPPSCCLLHQAFLRANDR